VDFSYKPARRVNRRYAPVKLKGAAMFFHRPLAIAALAAASLVVPAFAADAVSKKDQEFFTKAAGGGMYEVEAGKLAEAKATDPQVKSFGAMLVKDHGAANEELKALASRKGAQLPGALPADKQKKIDKLSQSKNFDKDFIQEVGLKDHKADIGLFEKASKGADDADVKAFAAKTLPTLRQHREHAQGLEKAKR
jgi:putative membrane protein